jgi:hypothetical protein
MSRIGDNSGMPKMLRAIFGAGRPLVEQSLDLTEQMASLREDATAKGFDWSQIKALLKAQIQDERDDGHRVKRIIEKADFATAYADMLGLGKVNENKCFSTPHNPITGEVFEPDEHPAGSDPLIEQEPDDAERRLVTKAPLESGAGAAESPSEGGRPVDSTPATEGNGGADAVAGSAGEGEGFGTLSPQNSETEAPPSPASAGEGAGVEPAAAALPAPSTDDDDWVIDKITGELRPWCPDRDMPDYLRRAS